MSFYVDEMPKDCFECPCFRFDLEKTCALADINRFDVCYYRGEDAPDNAICPLKELKEIKNEKL